MSVFARRVKELRTIGKQAGIDAFLVVSEKNMRYLDGFSTLSMERFTGIVIPVEARAPVVIVPSLEKTKAEEKPAFGEIRSYSDSESPASSLSSCASTLVETNSGFLVHYCY